MSLMIHASFFISVYSVITWLKSNLQRENTNYVEAWQTDEHELESRLSRLDPWKRINKSELASKWNHPVQNKYVG